MKHITLSNQEEEIGKKIVHAAFLVHKNLGPGLLESIYENCFCYELERSGLKIKRQAVVPLIYDGISFNCAFKLDVLIEDAIICELKAVETMHPIFEAQLLTYMKLTKKQLGFLINFNVDLIKNGIRRMILAA
ncbi:MAG: GxxExxY protein [bacterium]